MSTQENETTRGTVNAITPLIDLAPEGLAGVGSVFGRTRVRTLVSLRWMAVIGQVAAVLFVHFVLGYKLPLGGCLAVIAASAWVNVILTALHPAQRLASQKETALQSAFDVLQLTTLIGLTGGLDNPFLFMIVAPVTVAASRLRPAYALLLLGLGLSSLGLLSLVSAPLPWIEGESLSLPPTYRWGLFASVGIGLVFFAVSAWRTGRDEARLVRALEAAEEVLAKEQRLSALGALSAATAHELGTPLATIHLVAKELERATDKRSETYEDVSLIAEQAERCRNILGQISRRGEASDAAHAKLPVLALIKEISEPHMGLGINIHLTSEPLPDIEGEPPQPPEIRRRPELIHALGAFVENAVSFAEKDVQVAARWSDDELRIYIIDDGPGFSQAVLPKLGEPYLSQRGENQIGGGMGLGFFIARTLLERTGARMKPYNRRPPAKGAVVRVSWTLNTIRAAPGWSDE
ncbi:ActS/PrrB/RegB family redox-sensitive histidine kinase [Hirschia litorea]|uniref:histidine kinase n=1 Tax=Hirschia litorea TaxID=1199156 RepID=A0ABW2INQ4_9PROT